MKGQAPQFKTGDWVTVTAIPPDLNDRAGIGTPTVFQQALGGTFRIEGFGTYGHLELIVSERRTPTGRYQSDTIWIESEFVSLATAKRARKRSNPHHSPCGST